MIINYTSKRTHRPDVLGPNLVTNPGPFNNTTGWSAVNSATLSVASGKLVITYNGVASPAATTGATVEIGELYLVSISAEIGTSPNLSITIDDSTGGVVWIAFPAFTTNKTLEKYVRAETTNLTIQVVATNSSGTQYVRCVSASIRKVTTLTHDGIQLVRNSINDEIVQVTDPWTASLSTLSIVANKLRVTSSGAVNGSAIDYIPTKPGIRCSYSLTVGASTAGARALYFFNQEGEQLHTLGLATSTAYTGSFVPVGTLTKVFLQNDATLNAYTDYSAITVTQADSDYTIEKDIASESDERPSIGGWRQISIGGKAESNYGRKDEIHTVTTTAILSRSEADDWKEFFDSCAGGETFTIDLYQDPRPELITNGIFDTATTGWTGNAATLSVASRKLRVTNSGAAAGDARLSFSTTAGEQYTYYVDNTLGTAASSFIQVGTSAGASDILSDAMTVSKTYKNTFVATSSTTHLRLLNNSTTSAQYTDFDNVSVKSIATDNVVSAILEGDGKIDRISQHIYQATFSYRVI